jgi:hypothetical protein
VSQRTTEFAARITGDADGALAALEKVKVRVRETAAATASANTTVANSTGLLVKNSEKAAKGVAAITQALYAMEAEGSARVLAIGGAVGSFADLLGPGGKVVSGIAIVTASITALFLQAKEKSAEATKAIEDNIKSLVNAGDFAAITKRLQEIDQGTAGEGFNDGRSAIRKRIELLNEEALAAGKSAGYYRDRQNQIATERAKLKELTAEYDKYYQALTNPATGARGARGLAGQPITSSADSDEAIARRAKEVMDAAKKTAKETADAATKAAEAFKEAYSDSLIAVQSALVEADRELAELQASGIKRLGEESKARADGNTELQAQVIALGQGRAAYEALLLTQAQAQEVAKALATAEAAKLKLSPEQIDAIKAEVAERARLLKVAQALQALIELDGKSPFDIPTNFDGVGKLAEDMAMVASAAAGIATAFGEAGRNIAALLGQTGQLLTNLQRAQKAGVFTDLNGKEQNVGFGGALAGRAGAAGTAAAVSSALGVVGAVVSIGSALASFGADSRERARLLRERGVEFNQALEAFASQVSPFTGASQRIRQLQQQAEEARQKAVGASGLNDFFLTRPRTSISAAELEKDAEVLSRIALSSKSKENAEAARLLALRYTQLSEKLRENEAEARAQVVRNTEDLGVRELQAAGLTAEADALRVTIAARRELAEAERDVTTEGQAYLIALQAIQVAEAAAAAETRRRAAILQRLSDDDTFLGGTTVERFRRSFAALGESFTDFAGVFDQFDVSTKEGLEGAKAKIREIYETLAADGISEAERPIVDILRSILAGIDGAIADLPETLDPIATALEAFGERVRLFGTSLPDQLSELRTIFSGKFGDIFDEILTSADLGTDAGRAAFKDAIQAQLDTILADGVISESERAFYDVLVRFFDLANGAIADADAEAQRILEQATAQRQARRTAAANRINLFDLTGLDAFTETLQGLGPAFADLFDAFDLTTVDGITGAKEVLRGIFDELSALSDEELFERFGLTRDELVAALLDTDTGLDGLKGTLGDLADAAIAAARASAEFQDQLEQDFLRSQGRGQEADIIVAKAKRDERLKQAAQLGLGPDILAQIEGIYQADLAEIAARYAPAITAAADAASAPAPTSSGAASGAGTSGRTTSARRNTTVVGDFGGLSQILAESLAGLLREIAINTGPQGALVAALTGGAALRPLSSLSFPALPVSGGSGGGIVIGSISISIGSLNPLGMTPTEAAGATAREVARQLGRLAAQETRFLGSGVA